MLNKQNIRGCRITVATLALLILSLGFTGAALAAAKDDLYVTAKTSIGTPSVSPTSPGNAPKQWVYAFCLPSGSSLNQSFPVEFRLENADGTAGESANVSFNAAGSLSASTTVPTAFSISDNNTAQTHYVMIATGALADGTHTVNVQISATPASGIAASHNTLHVKVTVGAGCDYSGPSCFISSSEFDLLTDCSGAYVSGNTGGTFQINAPRGRVVATNPGQFYYNLVWTNMGSTMPVTIDLSASGLNPHGANAVHALVFDSSGFDLDVSNFDMVNQDGTPCGPGGPCTITVGAGKTLWVTWHLAYAGIGSSSSAMSNVCPGNVGVWATGTLKDSGGNVIGSCQATASGYLKK